MSYTITEKCNGCGACEKICPVGAISGVKKERFVIDQVLCIECGACGKICPQGAVVDASGKVCAPIKKSQWLKPEFNEKTCISCGICVGTCPVACLAMTNAGSKKDPHGHPYIKEPKACIACSFCAQDCPVDSILMVAPASAE